jgi:hypothetical protein
MITELLNNFVVLALLMLIVGVVLAIFLIAFVQGREIRIWPPRIGSKPQPQQKLSVPVSPPGLDVPPASTIAIDGVTHSIHGTWLCQYKYPRMNETTGAKEQTIEVQIVELEEHGGAVKGQSIHAVAHPEYFVGSVSLGRYFTGTYKNESSSAASYHGAFQFVLSHSKSRMKGRWVGFNREGTDVDSEEWRWERLDDRVGLPQIRIRELMRMNESTDLFQRNPYL